MRNYSNTFLIGIQLLSLACFFSCIPQNISNVPKKYTAEQFVKSKNISGLAFSEDGSQILYTSNETGTPSAWVYDIASQKNYLVHGDTSAPVYSLSLYSSENRLLYISSKDGSQYLHLYIKEEGGEVKDVTPGDNIRAGFRGMKNDYSGFYFTSNKRDQNKIDLYEYNFQNETTNLIFENNTNYRLGKLSPTHEYILLHELVTEEISNLFLYDLTNNKTTRISPENNIDLFYGIEFSLDGASIYYVSNYQNEFSYITRYDIKTGVKESIIKENWDVLSFDFSNDQNYMAFYINKNAQPTVRIKDLKNDRFLNLPFLENHNVEKVKFSLDNRYLVMQVTGFNRPKDIWMLDIQTGEAIAVVTSLNPDIYINDLVEPQDVMLSSFDGLGIPAHLYLPKQVSAQKSPALVWTHGGPGGQFMKTYNLYIQFMVNRGYTVLSINNRGSSGYGKIFKSLDNQRHGVDDLKDILTGKLFLEGLVTVDKNRIGIIGDSYGGYLVLAALTFYPDAFSVGVDMFGISNWLHVLNNIPAFWTNRRDALYEEIGHPVEDSVMLYNKSPFFFSNQIKSPLMVIQGANDPRVPQSESDQIVKKVSMNGIPVRYILFEDEGHGIRKNENKIEALKGIEAFLRENLK